MSGRRRKEERAKLYESPVYKDLQQKLSANVRSLRKAKGWTQEEAAHRCGMPVRLLQGVEAGTENVTLITLSRLVEGFEVDVVVLLGSTSEE